MVHYSHHHCYIGDNLAHLSRNCTEAGVLIFGTGTVKTLGAKLANWCNFYMMQKYLPASFPGACLVLISLLKDIQHPDRNVWLRYLLEYRFLFGLYVCEVLSDNLA